MTININIFEDKDITIQFFKNITLMNKYYAFLLIPFLFAQCKTKDYLTPHEYPGRIIEFGSGGGFTGKVKQFTILDNGQVFVNANKEGFVDAIKKLDKNQVKQLFDNYDRLNFKRFVYDNPGNFYHFVTMREEGKTHKLTWGNKDKAAPKELEIYHDILMSCVGAKKLGTKNFNIN